jgi:hypothetical protein
MLARRQGDLGACASVLDRWQCLVVDGQDADGRD